MSSMSKHLSDSLKKVMEEKTDAKITDQEIYHTTEEVYLELENKDPDSDYVYHAGVFLTVYKNADKKVMCVRVEGSYNLAEWKDIAKFISALG